MTTAQSILRYLKKHPLASFRKIAADLNLSGPGSAEFHIKNLIKAKKLSRTAPVPAVWKVV